MNTSTTFLFEVANLEGLLYLAIILDVWSQSGGLETGRNLESRVGPYRPGKRLDDAYPEERALFRFGSRQPIAARLRRKPLSVIGAN